MNKNEATLVVSSKEHVIPYGTCKLTKKGYLEKIADRLKPVLEVSIKNNESTDFVARRIAWERINS